MFYWSDAASQIFVAIVLLILWIQFVGVLIAAIIRKVVSAGWWLLVAWVAVVLFYLHRGLALKWCGSECPLA